MNKKPQRKNLSKEDIVKEMEQKQKVVHLKEVVRMIYPTLEKVDTIYDAQTAINALAGFIDLEIEKKLKQIKMADIVIDLSGQEQGKITDAMNELIGLLKDESAEEASETLDRLAQVFGQFGMHKFLKGPMSDLKVTELVTD